MKLRDLTDRQIEVLAQSLLAFDARVRVRPSRRFFGLQLDGDWLSIDAGSDAISFEVVLHDRDTDAVAFLRQVLPVDEGAVQDWVDRQMHGEAFE